MVISVLDCTLRDGGYINQWQFGNKNISYILKNLVDAEVDIIECGYITAKTDYVDGSSQYDSVDRISQFIPANRKKSMFVGMINYNEYTLENLPICDNSSVDGIRVTFHKKDMQKALKYCDEISKKGYKVFVQPMVSVSYSDDEFLELIRGINLLNPYAVYLVDSFGVMKRKDLLRLFYLIDHNLSSDIKVGYHSHNNLQLAYSNAQSLVDLKIKRDLIIDSSVFGMGRGAGNLNTELFIEYLNENNDSQYKQKPILQIIDEVLNNIYLTNYWGYSLPHYISATHNCHPNYASYLAEKNTLTIEDISNILENISLEKKNGFDKDYMDSLYKTYQSIQENTIESIIELEKAFRDKNIVIIASGSSINKNTAEIKHETEKNNTVTIAINFIPDHITPDYIFVGNLRRFKEVYGKTQAKIIVTSNIHVPTNNVKIVRYIDLINDEEAVSDNSGLMFIKLMILLKANKVSLAGFDGYSYDSLSNYSVEDLAFIKSNETVDLLNGGIHKVIKEFSKQIPVQFITKSKYELEEVGK
ncbi:aldolase catalytic domain-containing protein [Trichococcus shcherbakoviae]|uniref:aldolase catalytic domain-containing protein n=1 Tax=Trichococcus shcherbakoviae TaxID=2094020 RepID=UPI0029F5B8D9|nr:aldolase catalytic domain-containing protein [Trichococcus shcherbakoviae]